MCARKSGGRRRKVQDVSNISTFRGGMRFSRASLLAGASLAALATSAAPDRALAACSGRNQTISTHTKGPVLSNGGAITITTTGFVGGGTSQTGVLAKVCPVTTLTNSGII